MPPGLDLYNTDLAQDITAGQDLDDLDRDLYDLPDVRKLMTFGNKSPRTVLWKFIWKNEKSLFRSNSSRTFVRNILRNRIETPTGNKSPHTALRKVIGNCEKKHHFETIPERRFLEREKSHLERSPSTPLFGTAEIRQYDLPAHRSAGRSLEPRRNATKIRHVYYRILPNCENRSQKPEPEEKLRTNSESPETQGFPAYTGDFYQGPAQKARNRKCFANRMGF